MQILLYTKIIHYRVLSSNTHGLSTLANISNSLPGINNLTLANNSTDISSRISVESLHSMIHNGFESSAEVTADESFLSESWMKINSWNLLNKTRLQYLTIRSMQDRFNDSVIFDSFKTNDSISHTDCMNRIHDAYEQSDVMLRVSESYNHSLKMLIFHAKERLHDEDMSKLKLYLGNLIEVGTSDEMSLFCVINLLTYGIFSSPSPTVCIPVIASGIYTMIIDMYPNIPSRMNDSYLSVITNSVTSSLGVVTSAIFGPFKFPVYLLIGVSTVYCALGCVSPLLNMATLISKSSAQKKMITVGAASIVKATSNPDSDLYAKLCSWLFSS
jgi:hypothetical protein